MFDVEPFSQDCRAALADARAPKALRTIIARAVCDPLSVMRALGEPSRAGIEALHRSSDLPTLRVVRGPGMTIMPHNHRMAAVIGLCAGREDNIFWRRIETARGQRLQAAGAHSIGVGDCVPLGCDIIHSVTNPLAKLTAAIMCVSVTSSPWNAANGKRRRWRNGAAT